MSDRESRGSAPADAALTPTFPENSTGHAEPFLVVRPSRLRWFMEACAWWFDDFRQFVFALVAREREAGGFRNLVPVLVGAGAAIYFAAPQEPMPLLIIIGSALSGLGAMQMKERGAAFMALSALALVLVGMTAAQIRTRIVESRIVAGSYTGKTTGMVIWRDFSGGGRYRYLLHPLEMEDIPADQLPERIRLTASAGHEPFGPGEVVTGLARIRPYSGPLVPAGYDFSFVNWFAGLGGAGYFMGKPEAAGKIADSSFWQAAEILRNRFRMELARRIRVGLEGEQGEMAVALITGDRSGMSKSVQESLRQSGLAHILAISGLHMALVTMTMFWTVRFILALLPSVTLRYPVRKWAAALGMVTATAYLVISGASVATQRAWIMLCVMLIAIIIDRRAVTIRNVVLAATLILILAPESFLQPGFQMSFAAAAALVAAYSSLNQWRQNRLSQSGNGLGSRSPVITLMLYLVGLGFTSLIAGLATAPFSAWHFHRIAPLGLVANLLAMPIVSFAVMPLALLSAMLMPYGLEQVVLHPLGVAIGAVTDISAAVNELAPDLGTVGILPIPFVLCAALALALLTLFSTRLRWLGLAPLFCLLFFSGPQLPPDLVVSEDGRTVAMRDGGGKLALPYPTRSKFVTDIWLRAWSADEAGDTAGMIEKCDSELCLAQGSKGVRFAIVYSPDEIQQACDYADILAAPRLRWIRCRNRIPALVLTRDDFDRNATHIVRLKAASDSPAQEADKTQVATSDGGRYDVELTTTRRYRNRPWIPNLGPASTFAKDRQAAPEPSHDGG